MQQQGHATSPVKHREPLGDRVSLSVTALLGFCHHFATTTCAIIFICYFSSTSSRSAPIAILHINSHLVAKHNSMATNGGVSFRKIDSSKRSFFDLPGEVRELVYQEHFRLLGDYNIHLTNVAPGRPARAKPSSKYEPSAPSPSCGFNRRAVISTEYCCRLRSRERRFEQHQAWKENINTMEELTTTLAKLDIAGYTSI